MKELLAIVQTNSELLKTLALRGQEDAEEIKRLREENNELQKALAGSKPRAASPPPEKSDSSENTVALQQRYNRLKEQYQQLEADKAELQQAFEDVLEQVDQFSSKMEGIGNPT